MDNFSEFVLQQSQKSKHAFTELPICRLILCLAVLLIFSSPAFADYIPAPQPISNQTGVEWTLSTIMIGFILYRIRCAFPFYYGLLEIIAAICTMFFSIAPAIRPINYCVSGAPKCETQSYLIILGGIYIFVRGMDNMGQHLPYWIPPKLRELWPPMK